MGTEDAIVFTTGHQANVGTLGTILGPSDTVIADSGDHASILDGCLLSRAKLRPFRHNRLDRLERTLEKAATDGGGILVVVDGVFSMEGDVAPLPQVAELCERFGARLMVDEAHGAGVLGARGAGTAELMGVEDRCRPAHGHVLEEPRLVRRLRGRLARGDRLPAHPVARLPLHGRRRARRRRRRARRAADHPLRRGAARCSRACSKNAVYLNRGLHELGFHVVEPQPLPDGSTVITPIVPVVVGDDWKAVYLWRALYDAGVFVNVALHPAVPPGGALLRTSVMATHDRATLDLALERFAAVKARSKPNTGRSRTSRIALFSPCCAAFGVEDGTRTPREIRRFLRATRPRGR